MSINHRDVGSRDQSGSWAQVELSSLQGCEKRLQRRLTQLLEDCASKPGASLPRACGTWARSKAAYRCLSNPTVETQELLHSHVQATWQRMSSHEVVLAIADTTSLNHTTHPATTGLGPLNKQGSSARGLHLHSILALSQQGEPLGLLHTHTWARARVRGHLERKRDINRLAPQDKESHRWLAGYQELVRQSLQHQDDNEVKDPAASSVTVRPRPRLIMVADREADIYELFLAAESSRQACGLLVRALHPRRLEEQQTRVVWDHLQSMPVMGCLQIKVPRQGSRAARTATLSVRSAAVSLGVPRDKRHYFGASEALHLWCIEAVELNAPQGQQALHWKLLSTEETVSFEQAIRQLNWYSKRWSIEVFHKTLKSGCRTEERQLSTLDRLERMLMLDMIVAWRIHAMTYAARERPEASASEWLSEQECRVLSCWATQSVKVVPTPSIKQAVIWIAKLGGFLARKGDGEPGVQSLWLGLQQLQPMVQLWKAKQSVGNG